MKGVCIILCLAVYVVSAQQFDDYDPISWYDEVDFDKLFEESNEADIPNDDIVSSDEFANNSDNEEPLSQEAHPINDEEQKTQPMLAPNILDKYSDDYQIEDNRSEVKDDVPVSSNKEDTPNQEDLLKEIDNDFKELVKNSESQEATGDFDAFQKLIDSDDPQVLDMIKKVFSEDDGSQIDLSDLFSDEKKLEEDFVEPPPLPSLDSDNVEEINQNQDDTIDHEEDLSFIIERTKKILEETNNEIAEINNHASDVNIEGELNDDNVEKGDVLDQEIGDNTSEEDSVAQVYKDLNDDLDKLLETMNKLRQDKFSEEQNPDDSFDINVLNDPLEKAEDLELLHGGDQGDAIDYNDDAQDYGLKVSEEILGNKEDAAPHVYENDALEAADNNENPDTDNIDSNLEDEFYDSNSNLAADPKEDNIQTDTDFNSADSDESNPNFHPADTKNDDDNIDTDFNSANSENDFDESNPDFHPADSKKDDNQFDTDFNSADSENEFDEFNPDFHPADSKKDDDQFDADFNSANSENDFDESNPEFHPADSKKDDDQFDADFNSADTENEFEETNPNFHPADSKKDDDEFDADFNSANSENDFDESNPDFHPADSKENNDEFNSAVVVDDSAAINSAVDIEKTRVNLDEVSQAIKNSEEDDENETSEKKITKNVEDLTGAELDQLTMQFIMLYKKKFDAGFEDVETNADHVILNVDEPVVLTSPGYPSPYPTTGDSPMDWILDGEGHGIELNVTDLAINSAMGHYLLIIPGAVNASGSNGIVFAFRLDRPRKYRFRNVDRLFVRLEARGGMPFLRGFNMSVKMIEPLSIVEDDLPEPEPVQPAPRAIMTLLLGGVNTTEFEKIREEFRLLLADMGTAYINANGIDPGSKFTHFTTQITRTYVCNLNWPGFDSCVEVRFAIPLVYDEEDPEYHRLNEDDLIAMWYEYIGQDPFASRLRRMGITEYTVPKDGSVLLVWLVIAAGVLVSMMMLACTLWRFSCFNGYTRQYTQADTDSLHNEKRGLDMYPTPHQTLPPLYAENEYKWRDGNFDDSKVDINSFANRSYVRGDLSDESDIEITRDRAPPSSSDSSFV